jgi:hypothetical protein
MNLLYILLQSNIEGTLKLIDQYGVGLVALVVVGFFAWFLVKFILKRMKDQEKKIDSLIEKLINSKEEDGLTEEKMDKFAINANRVQQLIYHILNEFDADRVSVYEYHNGGKTITGVDFKKCSNTYEAVGLGIEESYNEHQNIPISINFLWNKLLMNRKPILISDISCLEKTDNTIFQILSSQGIKSYYSRLIKDYNGKPIGFMVIQYYEEMTVLDEEQLKIFSDTAISVGGLINKN